MRLKGIDHYFMFHIYNLVEYIILAYAYSLIYSNAKARKIATNSIIFYTFFVFINSIFIQSILENKPDSYSFALGCLLKIGLVLYYFYELYNDTTIFEVHKEPIFWISIGNFAFFAGVFFMMGLNEEIKKIDADLADKLHIINTVLNCVMYVTYSIGFLCKRQPTSYW